MSYVTPAKVLAHLDRIVGWQQGQTPAPVTLEADLSNRCYLRCSGCHFAYTHTKGPWALSADRPVARDAGGDLADVAITRRWLTEAAAFGVRGVTWTGGGEPTTHPDWPAIIAHAADCGLEQGMYTAGGLLTPTMGRDLAQRATWVVVSLDAPDAESYAAEKGVSAALFGRALAGIDALVGHRATVGVSFLIHAGNWRRMDEMLALGRAHGASYVTFRPMIQFSLADPSKPSKDRAWIADALPDLTRLSHEHDVEADPGRFRMYQDWQSHGYSTCRGITLNATITPDSRMWVCPNRREFPDSCLGDLKTESFQAIWSRHPGQWTDLSACRVMCRLHLVNTALDEIATPRPHEAFV